MDSVFERNAQARDAEARVGELMEFLARDRERFATEDEFRAYAIGAVRRFITDLRALDIEISLRDRHRTLS